MKDIFSLCQAGVLDFGGIQRRRPEMTISHFRMRHQQSGLYATEGSYPSGMLR